MVHLAIHTSVICYNTGNTDWHTGNLPSATIFAEILNTSQFYQRKVYSKGTQLDFLGKEMIFIFEMLTKASKLMLCVTRQFQ